MNAVRRDKFGWMMAALVAALVGRMSAPASGQYREDLVQPGKMRAVENPRIVDRPNAQAPLESTFTRADGVKVKLGDLFNHGRPVILSLVYFTCPKLCGLTQDSLANAVREGPKSLRLGKDYDIVVVSIDPDDAATAAEKRGHYLELMKRGGTDEAGLTYLTGTQENIDKVAEAVGFPYHRNFDDGTLGTNGKFAHDSGIFVMTQYGRVSRTIKGMQYHPDELHFALGEAAGGRIGTGFEETVSIPCGAMRFNPKTGRYESNPWFWAGTAVGGASVAFVAIFLGLLWRGEFKKKQTGGPDGTPALHA